MPSKVSPSPAALAMLGGLLLLNVDGGYSISSLFPLQNVCQLISETSGDRRNGERLILLDKPLVELSRV